jgi:hypothetical protein
MKPPAPQLPRIPRGRVSPERRRESFRRDHAVLIEQKLEKLRRAWEAKRDPGVVVDAMWLCDTVKWPRPSWLEQAAPKFAQGQAVDMGRVDVGEVGKVIFRRKHKHAGSRLGRRSFKLEVRTAAERELRRGDPGIDLEPYAKRLRDRSFPSHDEDEPPTRRTVMDYISSRPSLWTRYVKPRNRRRQR